MRPLLASLPLLVGAACGEPSLRDARVEPERESTRTEPVPDAGPSAPADVRRGPPYPIVLAHGFGLGARLGPLEYWWKIPDVLREAGEQVFVMANDPLRPPADRAVALGAFVDEVLARTNARRVNVVGHSMGGLDARLLVSALGYADRVASITTIATPHRGSPVADAILGLIPGVAEPTVAALVNAVGELIDGDEQDVLAAANALTTAGLEAFNRAHPDVPGVAMFSVVGETSADPFFVLNGRDYCDAPLWATYGFLALRGEPSDGLVPLASQRWGEVLRTLPADHLNQVAHPFGVVAPAFDWKATYLDLARTLHARGH